MTYLATDLLRRKFGDIKPLVLYQSDEERTIAVTSDDSVRAYAFVRFKEGKLKFPEIHREIKDGVFIGEAFRKHSIPVERIEKVVFRYTIPDDVRLFEDSEECQVKAVDFYAEGSLYASIIEMYPPAMFETNGTDIIVQEEVRSLLDSYLKSEEPSIDSLKRVNKTGVEILGNLLRTILMADDNARFYTNREEWENSYLRILKSVVGNVEVNRENLLETHSKIKGVMRDLAGN